MCWPEKGAAWPPCFIYESIENGIARNTVALHHYPQVPERLQLDLPDPLAGDSDFLADALQRFPAVAVQAETALHDFPLFFAQLTDPAVDDGRPTTPGRGVLQSG